MLNSISGRDAVEIRDVEMVAPGHGFNGDILSNSSVPLVPVTDRRSTAFVGHELDRLQPVGTGSGRCEHGSSVWGPVGSDSDVKVPTHASRGSHGPDGTGR